MDKETKIFILCVSFAVADISKVSHQTEGG
jgi:hypothetical protein